MSVQQKHTLAYLITVGRKHFLPTAMLLAGLTSVTDKKIYLVGNLDAPERDYLKNYPVTYIDENDIDFSGRIPAGQWNTTYREWGWYKQQFIRLCADRFIDAEHVVILDSEVFVFDNWDEGRFFTASGAVKNLYWVSAVRKSPGTYQMYRGAAFLLKDLPGMGNIMAYADSDDAKRHISGVQLFSTRNLRHIWDVLAAQTDLEKNMKALLREEGGLSFSEFQFYGLANEFQICSTVVRTELADELLGWYDVHNDVNFMKFRNQNPMWSMCQRYYDYMTPADYIGYMTEVAADLGMRLPMLRIPKKG